MFRHANDQRRLFRALVGQRSGALVQRQVDRMLTDVVRADLELHGMEGDDRASEVGVRFVVSAYMGLLTWWLEHLTPATPEDMNEAFRALVLPGVASFLGAAPRRAPARARQVRRAGGTTKVTALHRPSDVATRGNRHADPNIAGFGCEPK